MVKYMDQQKGINMKALSRLLATAAIAAVFAGCATMSRPAHDTLIAHRGESVDAPENTLPAYRLAVERGFGFECDLYLSKDGRVFTFHDGDLSRTTDGQNKSRCSDVSWEDTVSKLDVGSWGKWKGSEFAGTHPALLEDVLALARDGRRIYLEVKSGPEIAPVLKSVLSAQTAATPRNVLFISFKKEVCGAIKDAMPEYTVYLLSSLAEGTTPESLAQAAREARADGVDVRFDANVVTEEFVAAVKAEGLSFHVWTLDELPLVLRAFAVGADTVTTNCAKQMYDEYCALYAPQAEERDEFSDRIQDGAAFPVFR